MRTWCPRQCTTSPPHAATAEMILLCFFIGCTSCLSIFVRNFNLMGHKNLQGGYPLRLFFETGGAPAGQGFNLWRVSFCSHGSRDWESCVRICLKGQEGEGRLLCAVINLVLLPFWKHVSNWKKMGFANNEPQRKGNNCYKATLSGPATQDYGEQTDPHWSESANNAQSHY